MYVSFCIVPHHVGGFRTSCATAVAMATAATTTLFLTICTVTYWKLQLKSNHIDFAIMIISCSLRNGIQFREIEQG